MDSSNSRVSLSNEVYCLPAEQNPLSTRKTNACKDILCGSMGCRRPENDTVLRTVQELDCDSCEEMNFVDEDENADDSSLEETLETINEVLKLGDSPVMKQPSLKKQETKKVASQCKDASALKSFAYGK